MFSQSVAHIIIDFGLNNLNLDSKFRLFNLIPDYS